MNASEIIATLATIEREARSLSYADLLAVDEAVHMLKLDIEKHMEGAK